MSLRTEYEFTLPRGYVDDGGTVHRTGTMRLATARDELEPLRHPTVTGPDDPRLTVIILSRVVTKLGDLAMVTSNEIEGLFAADLAFLQDFYGVINFGTQEEYEELLAAQAAAGPAVGSDAGAGGSRATQAAQAGAADTPGGAGVADGGTDGSDGQSGSGMDGGGADTGTPRPTLPRTRVEEIPRDSR